MKSILLRLAAFISLALAALLPARADPGYYLLTPYSQPGQVALDLRYWTVDRPGREAMLWPELGLRYGVNSRWTTELLASWIGKSASDQRLSSWNWQNSVLLTQGQYPFDLAVHAQLIHEVDEGNVLELGPLFQTDIGFTQLNANLLFEHVWADSVTNLKYQWQLLRRLRPGLRLGVQGFGELGKWDHWSDRQSHRAGPVLRWTPSEHFELQTAYLWGKVNGRRAEMFSAQVLVPF